MSLNSMLIDLANLLRGDFQYLSLGDSVQRERAMEKLYEWYGKRRSKTIAWRCSKKNFLFVEQYIGELEEIIRAPHAIDQRAIGLCGSARVAFALFNFFPLETTTAALDLLEYGECQINRLVLIPDNLREIDYEDLDSYIITEKKTHTGLSPFNFIFLGSLTLSIRGDTERISDAKACYDRLNGTNTQMEVDFMNDIQLFKPTVLLELSRFDSTKKKIDALVSAYDNTNGVVMIDLDSAVLLLNESIPFIPMSNHAIALMSRPVIDATKNTIQFSLFNWGRAYYTGSDITSGIAEYTLNCDDFATCFFHYYNLELP